MEMIIQKKYGNIIIKVKKNEYSEFKILNLYLVIFLLESILIINHRFHHLFLKIINYKMIINFYYLNIIKF